MERARQAAELVLRRSFCPRPRVEECLDDLKKRVDRGDKVVPSLPDLLVKKGFITREQHQSLLNRLSSSGEWLTAGKVVAMTLVVLGLGAAWLASAALRPLEEGERQGRSRGHYSEGVRLADQGAADLAAAAFTKALELDEGLGEAWLGRGEARLAGGDGPGAAKDFERALALLPGDAAAWRGRARARERLGDLAGAVADATRAIELGPGVTEAWLARGRAREGLGKHALAVEDFTRAADLDPNAPLPYLLRARSQAASGDRPRALADLEKCLQLAPPSWPHRPDAQSLLSGLR